MANTQGGTIVLGVAEKASGLVWVGVPDAAQLRTSVRRVQALTAVWKRVTAAAFC